MQECGSRHVEGETAVTDLCVLWFTKGSVVAVSKHGSRCVLLWRAVLGDK